MKSILGNPAAQWFLGIWKWLADPVWMADARDRHLSRILNIILLVLFIWGAALEALYRLGGRLPGLASFLLAADQAELMAKRLGKNRIVSAADPGK